MRAPRNMVRELLQVTTKRLSKTVVDDLAPSAEIYWDLRNPTMGVRVGKRGKHVVIWPSINGTRVWEKIGRICQETPFDLLAQRAKDRIEALRNGGPKPGQDHNEITLKDALDLYCRTTDPPLNKRSIESYTTEIERGFSDYLQSPISVP